eukprot:scaffold23690_cov32-Tisochrysis_lutea.AAC.3
MAGGEHVLHAELEAGWFFPPSCPSSTLTLLGTACGGEMTRAHTAIRCSPIAVEAAASVTASVSSSFVSFPINTPHGRWSRSEERMVATERSTGTRPIAVAARRWPEAAPSTGAGASWGQGAVLLELEFFDVRTAVKRAAAVEKEEDERATTYGIGGAEGGPSPAMALLTSRRMCASTSVQRCET